MSYSQQQLLNCLQTTWEYYKRSIAGIEQAKYRMEAYEKEIIKEIKGYNTSKEEYRKDLVDILSSLSKLETTIPEIQKYVKELNGHEIAELIGSAPKKKKS